MEEITQSEILRGIGLAPKSSNNRKHLQNLMIKIDSSFSDQFNLNSLIAEDYIFFGHFEEQKKEKEKKKEKEEEKKILVGYKSEKKLFEKMIEKNYLKYKLKDRTELENDWRNYWGTICDGVAFATEIRKMMGCNADDDLMGFWIASYKPIKPKIYKVKQLRDYNNNCKPLYYPIITNKFETHKERQEFIDEIEKIEKLSDEISHEMFEVMRAYSKLENYNYNQLNRFYNRYYQTFKTKAS